HATTTSVVFADQPKGETKFEFRATYPDEEAAKKADADFRNDPEATRKQLAEQRRQLELKVRDADPAKVHRLRDQPAVSAAAFAIDAVDLIDQFLKEPPKVEGNELGT